MPYKDPEKRKEHQRQYYNDNKDAILSQHKQYYNDNKESIQAQHKQYRDDHLEETRARDRQYVLDHKEEKRLYDASYREKHKEKRRAQNAAWAAQNPDKVHASAVKDREKHREERNRKLREKRAANPESRQGETARYRAKYPGRAYASQKASLAQHPETKRRLEKVKGARRKTRKQSLPFFWNTECWAFALAYWQHCCAVCKAPLEGLFHTEAADHWIPLASPECPGTIPTNMLPLCHGTLGCNNAKQDKEPAGWLNERYGKRKTAMILKRIAIYFEIVRERFPLSEKGI